jgi:hypothetical protein
VRPPQPCREPSRVATLSSTWFRLALARRSASTSRPRRALYYNVSQAGRDGLLRDGSAETANPWSTTLPSDGDYVIDVYFMRNEARRGTPSTYTLKATITGGAPVEAAAPSTMSNGLLTLGSKSTECAEP